MSRGNAAMPLPTVQEMEAYKRIAHGVIVQAVLDATITLGPAPGPGSHKDALGRWYEAACNRDSARTFLTTPNPCLEFWCVIGHTTYRNVLKYAKAASTDWDALRRLHALHPHTVVALLEKLEAREDEEELDDL